MAIINDIYTIIRNRTLNAMGVERTLEQLLEDKDIGRVKELLQNRDEKVDEAIMEYNPALHNIHRKMDKVRSGRNDYRTEKLPRARQRYINEVELFFLLGNPIIWQMAEGGNDDAYSVNIR